MKASPRVALFTDSYLEVNGVANTSRQLAAYAQRHGHPFLVVHAGSGTEEIVEGSLRRLMLYRSGVGFRLDDDLRFDLLLWRHGRRVAESLRRFRPDLVHLTGPSDLGLLGAFIAWRRRIPVVLSWHTNVHEYARTRCTRSLDQLGIRLPEWAGRLVEAASLFGLTQFYRVGRVVLAPNEELAELIGRRSRRPVFLMRRGVDTTLFTPEKRDRQDDRLNLGYVGRLSPEKNVRQLARLEAELLQSGCREIKFTIVGAGSELHWLRESMKSGVFTGVLSGEALARAYANMDLFIFPSTTDTYGNVVLEAQAAGVPAIISDCGGPKFIVREGETGGVARRESDWAALVRQLYADPAERRRLAEGARRHALGMTWERIFDEVYRVYETTIRQTAGRNWRQGGKEAGEP